MKEIIILILIVFIGCNGCNLKRPASNLKNVIDSSKYSDYVQLNKFNNDTLLYLEENFVNRKNKYIGKPLKYFLDDIELKVVNYYYWDSFNVTSESPGISIQFLDYEKTYYNKKNNKPKIVLNIKWESPISLEEVISIGKNSKGLWTEDVYKYYSSQKIGDINLIK